MIGDSSAISIFSSVIARDVGSREQVDKKNFSG